MRRPLASLHRILIDQPWTVAARATFALLTCTAGARAQWVEQQVHLMPGWNSVYLEVDPVPAEADALFAGQPIEAVWSPAEELTADNPPQCGDPNDPACAPAFDSDWRVWLPPANPGSIANTLRVIRGGRAYLIKGSAGAELTMKGRPDGLRTAWRAGFNLAGFHVVRDPITAPTFAAYLAPSSAHVGTQIYQIQADASLSRVSNLSQARITPGKSYWVKASGACDYDGPVSVDTSSLRGVDFGLELDEHSLALENLAAVQRSVTVTVHPSAAPPAEAGAVPRIAGDVPLAWLEYGSGGQGSQEFYQWHALQSASWPLMAAHTTGSFRTITMAVQRAGLDEAVVGPDGSGAQYESVVEVTDGAGYRRLLAATAQAGSRAGLWTGRVTVDSVSWVTADLSGDADTITPRPAPTAFSFPVIVHCGGGGGCKLLSEVTMMWQPDQGNTDAGQYVLVTPAAPPGLVDQLEPGSQRDGEPFSRRASTAAFSFDGDLPLVGDLTSELEGQTTIPANHRLNPFKHKYHPDHDCDQSGECYEITRRFTLTFEVEPPPGLRRAGWGDSMLGGTYTEQVEGLHRDTIYAAGRFELHRASHVPTLNAQ